MPAAAVLINADDLGLAPAVDRGIFAAWQAGAVGDSTVFANAPDLPALLDRARAAGLPVGLHLNLTLGRPLADPAELPALVKPDGTFLRRQQWAHPLPAEQVARELSRQLARLQALGWTPSHLDSHHHIHRYPEVLHAVIALARAHHLPVRAIDPPMRDLLRAAGVPAPDHFTMAFYGDGATVETLITQADACPGGVLEIMTHPGEPDPALASSYRAERAVELATLTDPAWHVWRQARGIPVVGYGAMTGG